MQLFIMFSSVLVNMWLDLRCDKPPGGRNLKLAVSNGRDFGSEIIYSCDSPYNLRGSAKRTCRATGEWDGKKAKCSEFDITLEAR